MNRNQRGFSLVELLVVMVIMGLVVASIYTLYLGTQRTAITSEEVVEVQQNLRFALDQVASDIRLAGFLIDTDNDFPIEVAPNRITSDDGVDCDDPLGCFTIRTYMPSRRYARIESSVPAATNVTLTLASAEMVDLFLDENVSVIRPSTGEIVAGATGDIEVTDRSRNTSQLTIGPLATNPFSAGDIVAPAPPAAGTPSRVLYRLEPDPLAGGNVRVLTRAVDGLAREPVAGKISDLTFDYVLADGSPRLEVTDDERGDIVAVRITIVGQTDETMTGRDNFSGIKTRALETVVRLRNR